MRGRWTDGRQRDESGRKRSRDGVWQPSECAGLTHIRRGHDSTCRLSPAGSTLGSAMLFWLGTPPPTPTPTHRHICMGTQSYDQIQLPPPIWFSHLISRHTHRHTRSHPKCHVFGEHWPGRRGPGLMETLKSLL